MMRKWLYQRVWPVSGYHSHAITVTEWIGGQVGAFRIIDPLAIHEKTVLVGSWIKRYMDPPSTIFLALEFNGLLLPVRKIAGQEDLFGFRGRDSKLHLGFDILQQHKASPLSFLSSVLRLHKNTIMKKLPFANRLGE